MEEKVIFSLTDNSGVLRFESFEAVNAPELEETVAALRTYLVGRPLVDADMDTVDGLLGNVDGPSRIKFLDMLSRLKQLCRRF
jgi:hypothetical protein